MNFLIDSSNEKNRKLLSQAKFPKNTLIFDSEAFLWTVLAGNLKSVCSYCLSKETALSLCAGCLVRSYCGKECQKNDWMFGHKQECGVLKKIKEKGGEIKLNTLFLLTLRLLFLKEVLKNSAINEKMKLFLSNKEIFPPEKQEFFKEMAIILLKYMAIEITIEKLEEVIELICKISINAFTIYSYFDEPVGLGLFYPNNFMNHNCEPNCVVFYVGKNQRVFTKREVEKGEEITISYYFQLDDERERIKKFLMENYLFLCKCQKCEKKEEFQKSLSKEINAKKYADQALEFIGKEKYQDAYLSLKNYIKIVNNLNEISPEIGWKYAELSKTAKLLGKLKKSIFFGQKALEILMIFYQKFDKIKEIREIVENMEESKNYIGFLNEQKFLKK